MQTTNHIFLVKPLHFAYNVETALSNSFQNVLSGDQQSIQHKVDKEFDNLVQTLKASGVSVLVFDDTAQPVKPDAVFPNNWISLHRDGKAILYPMCAPNRRAERRQELLDALQEKFYVSEVIDFSHYENEGRYLEGTGSIVFDHQHKTAYACLSPRTDKELLLQVCQLLQYKPVYFYAYNAAGKEIYHTNVMMCVGEGFAIVCLESITAEAEREKIVNELTGSGRQIIDITYAQMNQFAGNMLQLQTTGKKDVLALSASAYNSLDAAQKKNIEKYVTLLPMVIPTIETIGGGSVRCMIAEIFLPLRQQVTDKEQHKIIES